MAIKTYNFGEVQCIVGTRRLRGVVSVTVARDEDSFTKQVGGDGEVSRSKTNNRTGNAEIVLMGTSEDNAYLQQLSNTDENTGTGVVPFKCSDKSGTYQAIAAEAWVRKPADMAFERDSGERTWVVDLGNLDILGGGN